MNRQNLSGGTDFGRRLALLNFHATQGLRWILAFTFGLWVVLAQGEEFRYRYIDLNEGPPGYNVFFPTGINDSGQVAFTVANCDDVSCSDFYAGIYKNGAFTLIQPGISGPINAGGTIGGGVNIDSSDFTSQSALFHKDKSELIPPLPGEYFSSIVSLNDSGSAIVDSFDEAFNQTLTLYQNGQNTVLDFGPTVMNAGFISRNCIIYSCIGRFINNQGVLAGTTYNSSAFDGARGFRFDPGTGKGEVLQPVSPDTLAWGLGINQRGEVHGYSFVATAPYHERIGVWDKAGNFTTYVDETTSSNYLLFNDHNQIVRTLVGDNNSYLLPKPGERLNLADLVEDLPSGATLEFITDFNNQGDMIGSGSLGYFMLERIAKSK